MGWKTTSTTLERLALSERGSVWDQVLGRFRRPILHFAQRMGLPEEEAEEVTQETLTVFTVSFREGRYDRSKGRLSHWLFGIATRQILCARRRLAARAARLRVGKDTSFWSAVPDKAAGKEFWVKEWERAVLQAYLNRVRAEVSSETYRAFHMVVSAGRTPAETAFTLGIPVKTVYNAKHRVLQRIRQLREELDNGIGKRGDHALS